MGKIWYYENKNTGWGLTNSINIAKRGSVYRQATVEDLYDWGCEDFFFEDKVVQVKEGNFKWNKEKCEYIIV